MMTENVLGQIQIASAMTESDPLATILENIHKREILDPAGLEILLSALRSGQITLATGERSVAIGGSADGATIVTGDLIAQGLDAKAVKELIQSALKNKKAANSQTADRQSNPDRSGKKIPRTAKATSSAKSTRKPKIFDSATLVKIAQNTAILGNILKTEPEKVKALLLLGKIAIGHAGAIQSVMFRLKLERNDNVIAEAIKTLAKIDKDKLSASSAILKVLAKIKNSSAIISAMVVLAKIATDNIKVVQPMLGLLSNDDRNVKKAVIISLGAVAVGHKTAIDRLLCILESNKSSSAIEQSAANSLGEIIGGDRDALKRIERVITMEKSDAVKKRIAIALNKIEPGNQVAAKYRAGTNKIKLAR